MTDNWPRFPAPPKLNVPPKHPTEDAFDAPKAPKPKSLPPYSIHDASEPADVLAFLDAHFPELVPDKPAAADDSTNPKDRLGAAKPGFTAIPASALVFLGQAMKNGREKYGLYNWREKQVVASIYIDAGMRHKLAWWDGEEIATDSLVHHLAHDMACSAIILDALVTGKLVDDRGPKGTLGPLIDFFTSGRTAADLDGFKANL